MAELHNATNEEKLIERKQDLIEPNKTKLYLYFITNSGGKPLFGENIRSIIHFKKFQNLQELNDYGISNVLMEDSDPSAIDNLKNVYI
jgi:hypothetical protein